MINIALAEDNSFALKAIIDKLRDYPDIKISVTARNGFELLEKLKGRAIDVVLMDLEMPVLNGIEATFRLKKNNPKIKVIALTTFDDDDKIMNMIMAGASGYLLKEETKEVIHQAILEIVNNGASMSASIALKVINLLRTNPHTMATTVVKTFDITKREMEVLVQLRNGLTYEQIANNLFISTGTVRKHIEQIYRKLQVTNKVEAINLAIANRVI